MVYAKIKSHTGRLLLVHTEVTAWIMKALSTKTIKLVVLELTKMLNIIGMAKQLFGMGKHTDL